MDTSDPRVIRRTTELRFVRDQQGRFILQQKCELIEGAARDGVISGLAWLDVALHEEAA